MSSVLSVGHMQLAQVPGRHEPNSAGEVNFTYLFKLLEELGYEGYIGLEYNPAGILHAKFTYHFASI